MELKWIAMAAFVAAAIPATAAAQSKTSADTGAAQRSSTSRDTVTSTSTGDVSSQRSSTVTPEMLKAQQDPKIIGSPAWWKTHGTADGKPVSAPPSH
jgi:hypothetical protein